MSKQKSKNEKMFSVFEGIIDSAASEYFDYNTANTDRIDDYATSCEISLDSDRLNFLLQKFQEYKNTPPDGTNDFYHRFEKEIFEYEEK